MSLTELIVSIAGDMSKFSQTIKQATDEVAGAGKKLQDVGKSLSSAGTSLTTGVTAPILAGGAAFVAAAKMGADFEKGMAQVYTLVPNLSKAAFSEMSADTLQFAKDMRIPTEEVLPAMYDAISAGVPTDNIFSFLEASQKAAIAGNTDLGVSVDALTSIVNAYGAENLDVANASDILFTGVRLGKTTFEELQKSLYEVIPTASSLGVPLEEVTGALAAMTAQGTPTGVATAQLRQMFVELSKEGSGAAATFEEIAGVTFPQFIAQGGSLQDALGLMSDGFTSTSPAAKELQDRMMELADPTSGLALEFESLTGKTFKDFQREGGTVGEALKTLGINTDETDARLSDMFGSVEAGNAVLSLTSRDGEILNKVMGEMTDTTGATDDAFNKMSETSSRSFDAMSADIKNAVTEMGLRLLPVIQDTLVPLLTDTLIPAFESAIEFIADVAEAFNTLPQPVKVVMLAIVAFIAALGPFLVVAGAVVGAVGAIAAALGTGGILSVAFAAAQTAVGAVITAIAGISAPILIIVGVIALFTVAWTQNWFDIQGKTKAAIDFIITQAKALWKALGDTWNAIIKAGGDLKTAFADLGTALSNSLTKLKDQFGILWTIIKTAFNTAITEIINYVSQFAVNLLARLQNAILSIDTFKNQATAAWTAIKTAVFTILTALINDLLTWINNLVIKFADAINRVTTFKTQVLVVWSATKAAVLAVLNGLISDLLTWISNQTAKFNDSVSRLNTFKAQATAAWNATKAAVLAVLNNIISDFATWISNQVNKLNDMLSKYNTFKTNVVNAWNSIKTSIQTTLNGIITEIQNATGKVKTAIDSMVTAIKNKGTEFYNAGANIIDQLKKGVESKIQGIKDSINKLTSWISDNLPHSPAKEGPLSQAIDFSSYITTPLKTTVKDTISQATSSGKNIINSVASGIKSAASSAGSAIKSAYTTIRSYMPFSPADIGPFSEVPDWDSVFYDPLLKSIQKTDQLTGPLEASLSRIRSPLDNLGGGFGQLASLGDVINNSGDTITVGPNNITNGVDLQSIIDAVNKQAAEKRRARGMYR